jgi:predicted NBD/HSP70 family sugar kinase
MHDEVTASTGALSKTAQAVFQTLMTDGPLSRAELSRRLSLSAASLTKITRPLLEAALFVEVASDDDSAAVGRPPQPLDVNVDFAHFAGIKLTGEAIFLVTTDARGRMMSEREEPLRTTDPEDVADQISELTAASLADDPRIVGIGIALSGNAVRASPVVRKSPFLNWRDVPLGDLVAERTGLPVTLENDVRAVTAAEQWFGNAPSDSFVMLTFGAGIGCGIVANGQQLEGHMGASGLIGHTRVDDSGPLCYAGHPGCAHAYATIDGLRIRISQAHGRSLSYEECLTLHSQHDPAAMAAFHAAGRAIGTLLALVMNMIGPERVVISGEGVEIYRRSADAARTRMRELLHWTATEVAIDAEPMAFSEWARGAAVVAVQEHVRGLVANAR